MKELLTSKHKWGRRIALLAACIVLSACEEVAQTPQEITTLSQQAKKESGACNIFPSLDRVVILGSGATLPDPEGRIFAGYTTDFRPGSPPIACDRLHQLTEQGAFRFNVSSLRGSVPEPYRGAVLEIQRFAPVGRGIQIIDAEPWGLGFGEGWIGSSAPRNTCQFKVVRANQDWAAGAGGRGGAAISTQNLQTSRATFIAPITRTVAFDVSPEVGQWFRGERPELGFVIIPDDRSILSKASNSCVGLFSVRLRAFFGEDEDSTSSRLLLPLGTLPTE